MKRTGRSRTGFTLIEILVVITIIVMVFGFAMPVLGKYLSNQKLKAATGRVARVLLMARSQAITRHDKVYILFFHDRMALASERPRPVELFPYFPGKRQAARMVIRLQFAAARVEERGDPNDPLGLVSDLPKVPEGQDWTRPISARGLLTSSVIVGKKAYIAFNSDGTVEFGAAGGPGDRLSVEFWQDPPRNADIVIEERGNKSRGWIDIRATGHVETKIAEGEPPKYEEEEQGEAKRR